jgi:hypothetical protein
MISVTGSQCLEMDDPGTMWNSQFMIIPAALRVPEALSALSRVEIRGDHPSTFPFQSQHIRGEISVALRKHGMHAGTSVVSPLNHRLLGG